MNLEGAISVCNDATQTRSNCRNIYSVARGNPRRVVKKQSKIKVEKSQFKNINRGSRAGRINNRKEHRRKHNTELQE